MTARTERWTRNGETAYVIVQADETVIVTYELAAQVLAAQGFKKEAAE